MFHIIKFLILCLMASWVHASEYNLSVCAIFNNEAEYLKEWIDYHRALGVEHFYLYNNNSTDHFQSVLKEYDDIVEWIDWPSPPDEDWVPAQIHAYNHCCKTCDTKWLAIIDIDEFIVPILHDSITSFLEEYESFGGVKIFWQTFGTSFLPKLPEDKKMIESLVLKYPWDHPRNKTGKCIIRPERVAKCHIHDHAYFEGFQGAIMTRHIIQLNHYWTRAEDYFFNQKIPRMSRHDGKPVPQEKIESILFDSNQVEDTLILKFVY
jgi:hypothetical protein